MEPSPLAPADPLPSVPTAPVLAAAPDSFLSLLAGKRKRQAMQRRKVFAIPGFDGCLGAKLRSADAAGMFKDEAASIGDDDGSGDLSDAQAAELMRARRSLIARACVEVMYRMPEHKESDPWIPFADYLADGLGAVKFDERLCLAMGAEKGDVESATDAVAHMIPYDFNLAGFYMDLVSWFAQENPGEDDELVGESFAAS